MSPIRAMPAGSVRPKSSNWVEGEIAYLKTLQDYTKGDLEALSKETGNYIPAGASNHPVIILGKGKRTTNGQFYLVCTVSAYSSGPENNYLAPWKQFYHSSKTPEDFRSFTGSELYRSQGKASKAALELKTGQQLPKPKTSWVYTQNAYIVPQYLLSAFTKSPYQLEMKQKSLADLMNHMKRSCRNFQRMLSDRRIFAPAPVIVTYAPKIVAPVQTKTPTWAKAPAPWKKEAAHIVAAPAPPKIRVAIPPKSNWVGMATAAATKVTGGTKTLKNMARATAIAC